MTKPDDTRSPEKRTIAPLFTWRSAISESCLKPVERHCLLSLSLYMNERGGSAYPGSSRLAHDTGYHVDTVKRALQVATDSGWLRIVVKGGSPPGEPRRATEYVAHVPGGPEHPVHAATGGRGSDDWGQPATRPGAQDLPITSLNTSENSANEVFEKDRAAEADASTPPWVGEGLTYREWSERQRDSLR